LFTFGSIADDPQGGVVIVRDLIERIQQHVHVLVFDEPASEEHVVALFGDRGASDLLDIDAVRDDLDGLPSGADRGETVGRDGRNRASSRPRIAIPAAQFFIRYLFLIPQGNREFVVVLRELVCGTKVLEESACVVVAQTDEQPRPVINVLLFDCVVVVSQSVDLRLQVANAWFGEAVSRKAHAWCAALSDRTTSVTPVPVQHCRPFECEVIGNDLPVVLGSNLVPLFVHFLKE
jgi:hypothetical protein